MRFSGRGGKISAPQDGGGGSVTRPITPPIETDEIGDDQVTQAKIANDAVGPDQIDDTSQMVTSGTGNGWVTINGAQFELYPGSSVDSTRGEFAGVGQLSSNSGGTLLTYTPPANSVSSVTVSLIAVKSDGSMALQQDCQAAFIKGASSVTQMGINTTTTLKGSGTTTGFALSISASSGDAVAAVAPPGAGGDIRYFFAYTILQRTTAS